MTAAGSTNATNRFAIDSQAVAADLDREGHSVVPGLLEAATAEELVGDFDDDRRYRSTIDMARHGYGVGTYRYFSYPLPPVVDTLRAQLYRQLVPVANGWAERLGSTERYPTELPDFLARCATAGQTRPTPLILRYHPGHYNCLHQDRYGEVAFPLQVAILLTPRAEFDGGELVLVEQRPRAQSRVHVVALDQGDAVVFPNQVRPALGARGAYRVHVRHGVATLRRGERHTLGVIFHDAA
jgi:uncharacterized protein